MAHSKRLLWPTPQALGLEISEGNEEVADHCASLVSTHAPSATHAVQTLFDRDERFSESLLHLGQQRLQKLEGEGDTGLDNHGPRPLFDSASAIHEYLSGKTHFMLDWLRQRTQFSKEDRARYIAKVASCRRKREEYTANTGRLKTALKEVEAKTIAIKAAAARCQKENVALRAELLSTANRQRDQAEEERLHQEMREIEASIAEGHTLNWEAVSALSSKEHDLVMERHKIALLQVELGELKLFMDDLKSSSNFASQTAEQLGVSRTAEEVK